jgi:hypothetical protein
LAFFNPHGEDSLVEDYKGWKIRFVGFRQNGGWTDSWEAQSRMCVRSHYGTEDFATKAEAISSAMNKARSWIESQIKNPD